MFLKFTLPGRRVRRVLLFGVTLYPIFSLTDYYIRDRAAERKYPPRSASLCSSALTAPSTAGTRIAYVDVFSARVPKCGLVGIRARDDDSPSTLAEAWTFVGLLTMPPLLLFGMFRARNWALMHSPRERPHPERAGNAGREPRLGQDVGDIGDVEGQYRRNALAGGAEDVEMRALVDVLQGLQGDTDESVAERKRITALSGPTPCFSHSQSLDAGVLKVVAPTRGAAWDGGDRGGGEDDGFSNGDVWQSPDIWAAGDGVTLEWRPPRTPMMLLEYFLMGGGRYEMAVRVLPAEGEGMVEVIFGSAHGYAGLDGDISPQEIPEWKRRMRRRWIRWMFDRGVKRVRMRAAWLDGQMALESYMGTLCLRSSAFR
ncbi:hypothetical protein K488DRAFT_82148 [Vararia minispora EC-137]|uniref:Uncharacterized protein n=1 Tax=Vararia minispora EC-137 TaxID=1314806 RepID=A0ACB8QWS3_9AGAM|nr:hypothetical protein K488DRAFT_82148 [Vararia minispora EC-137]